MATIERRPGETDTRSQASFTTRHRRSGALGWWAAFGAIGIGVGLETWIRWIAPSDFHKRRSENGRR